MRWIGEGFLQPKATVRWLIGLKLRFPEIVLVMFLAYLVSQILAMMVPGQIRMTSDSVIAHHVLGFGQALGMMFAIGGLISGFGRACGGKGDFVTSCTIVAWHTLVTSVLTPLAGYGLASVQEASEQVAASGAPPEFDGLALMALFTAVAVQFWLLASYVTELHGFRSVMAVIGVMFGVSLVIGVLMIGLIGGSA